MNPVSKISRKYGTPTQSTFNVRYAINNSFSTANS